MDDREASCKEQEITRIDLEEVSQDCIMVNKFFKGWKEGQALNPDKAEIIEGKRLLDVLYDLKTHSGYALSMITTKRWKLLKGEITRIDFIKDGVWTVKKYPYGWTARTEPLTTEVKGAEFDFDQALAYLHSKGWVTVRWDGGGRAWKYRKAPIRTKEEILSLRKKSSASHFTDGRRAHDLAYYF